MMVRQIYNRRDIRLFMFIVLLMLASSTLFGQSRDIISSPVQVVIPETINLFGTESIWLPGQIQDKLKSNLQDYLGLQTVVDSNTEKKLKQFQAESEANTRDENTAIELGKITSATYGLFSKIRRTNLGYSLSVDYINLSTGFQVASAISKDYPRPENLYESTGAVDEITIYLANKLNIKLNELTYYLLSFGSADFSIDSQLELARQNEEHYQKLMRQYDDELKNLSVSNDLSAVENKRKIEAEKALLAEKQRAEQKRLEELIAQKHKAEVDAQLEVKRSKELKEQRDILASQASAKAAEVRELKYDRQGVIGQINVIESKKKALVEIRQAVEERCLELYEQMTEDRRTKEEEIRNKSWSPVELKDGQPTEKAIARREKDVEESNKKIEKEFITECENTIKANKEIDKNLLSEIRSDSKKLSIPRNVNSLGDELKVSYGTYDGEKAGWNAYLSLYSDGVAVFSDQFLIRYKAVTGKDAPDITTATSAVMDEYIANTDMYSSLLLRGDPILYFELDYRVMAEEDTKPSQYIFNFDTVHIFNTITGWEVQTTKLGKSINRTIIPEQNLEAGITEQWAKEKLKEEKKIAKQAKKIYKQSNIAPWADQSRGSGSLNGIGLDFSSKYWDFYCDIRISSWLSVDFLAAIPYHFSHYNKAFYNDSEEDDFYFNIDSPFILGGGLGINKRFHVSSFHPAIYYFFDLGYFVGSEIERKKYTYTSRDELENKSCLGCINILGLSCPIYNLNNSFVFAIDFKYSFYSAFGTGVNISQFSVGGRFSCYRP